MRSAHLVAVALVITTTAVAQNLNCNDGRDACLHDAAQIEANCLRLAAERNQTGPTDGECRANGQRMRDFCNRC
jgi:hypothetical protein